MRTVVVGTAGHIDHGKSSLVRALTGVDPDRLQEERERGMTIDLGFAPYRHRSGETVGIIDVPGHERFIRNMVAGATSVDVVLLVVAADDGVMPQTVEHVQILELLGVRRGLVALTKTDLVDDELAALAEQDVAALLAGTSLSGAPVLPVSTARGEGLQALREALDALVDDVPPREDGGPFRLPVQRVFSAPGRGLVVTGVPVSGRVTAGDELELVHAALPVRVRGVQAYGRERERGRAGHSTALNLAGAGVEDVRRGHVVASPGTFRPTRFVTYDHRHVGGDRALRARHPVRLHTGTAEVLGRAVPLGAPELRGEAGGPVQVRLDEEVVVAPGDRVLVRDAASLRLLGGGLVLAAGDGRLKRFKERVLGDLASRRQGLQRPDVLAERIVRAAGVRGCALAELALQVGRPAAELQAALAPAVQAGHLVRTEGDLFVSDEAFARLGDELLEVLKREHKSRPLLEWLPLADVRRQLATVPEALLREVLARDERVEAASGGRVRRRGHRVSLSAEQQAARERLLSALAEGGASPPPAAEALLPLPERERAALLDAMRRSGEVVVLGGLAFHAEALARLEQQLLAHGRARGGAIDIPALRDELGTTRKYLIPLLEHFDARGLTVRHGDRRVLRGGATATGAEPAGPGA